jgi:hypothetical protein
MAQDDNKHINVYKEVYGCVMTEEQVQQLHSVNDKRK